MSRLTNKEMKLSAIFPRTFGIIENVEISQSDIDIMLGYETHWNMVNKITKSTYVLDNPKLAQIRSIIEECMNQYVENIIKPMNYTKFKMTQSWINIADKGEAHHFHSHQNSLISGCLYLSADKNLDKIIFYQDNPPTIHIQKREETVYNADVWNVPVGTGDLIFFPSCLPHSVPANQREERRISLAFNFFADGILGVKDGVTELSIKMLGDPDVQQ